jgi:hypothetical protein
MLALACGFFNAGAQQFHEPMLSISENSRGLVRKSKTVGDLNERRTKSVLVAVGSKLSCALPNSDKT